MTKKLVKIVFLCIIVILIAWMVGFPYIKAEYLTFRHGGEFLGQEQQTKMLQSPDYLKVIEYSKSSATVYYVQKGNWCCDFNFERVNGEWKMTQWGCLWSKMGSADEFYWPYYR